MIEMGPSVENVYVTTDQINGRTTDALASTRNTMIEERAHRTIISALAEVIDSAATSEDMQTRFVDAGRFLIGMNIYDPVVGREEDPYDALLYAEAEGPLESGAFSAVRVGTWVRRDVEDLAVLNGDETLDQYLRGHMVTDLTDNAGEKPRYIWGVPVERRTVVTDLDGNNGYVYGHAKDLEAISALNVPAELKTLLTSTVKTWHDTEFAAAQE